jgi:hypothetical protein
MLTNGAVRGQAARFIAPPRALFRGVHRPAPYFQEFSRAAASGQRVRAPDDRQRARRLAAEFVTVMSTDVGLRAQIDPLMTPAFASSAGPRQIARGEYAAARRSRES